MAERRDQKDDEIVQKEPSQKKWRIQDLNLELDWLNFAVVHERKGLEVAQKKENAESAAIGTSWRQMRINNQYLKGNMSYKQRKRERDSNKSGDADLRVASTGYQRMQKGQHRRERGKRGRRLFDKIIDTNWSGGGYWDFRRINVECSKYGGIALYG